MVHEMDLELLESYLDGELNEAGVRELRQRLTQDNELADTLARLVEERELRASVFTAMEGDDPAVGRAVQCAQSAIRAERRWRLVARSLRYVAAAAACVTIGLLIANLRSGNGKPLAHTGGTAVTPVTYSVAITDETGRVMAIQKFDSLEKAQQFSEDLQQSEDRLHNLRNGLVTVRSAKF